MHAVYTVVVGGPRQRFHAQNKWTGEKCAGKACITSALDAAGFLVAPFAGMSSFEPKIGRHGEGVATGVRNGAAHLKLEWAWFRCAS